MRVTQKIHHEIPVRDKSNSEISLTIAKIACGILSIFPSTRLPAAIFMRSATLISTSYQAKSLLPQDFMVQVIKVAQAAADVLAIATTNTNLTIACLAVDLLLQGVAFCREVEEKQDRIAFRLSKIMTDTLSIGAIATKNWDFMAINLGVQAALSVIHSAILIVDAPRYRGKFVEIASNIAHIVITTINIVYLTPNKIFHHRFHIKNNSSEPLMVFGAGFYKRACCNAINIKLLKPNEEFNEIAPYRYLILGTPTVTNPIEWCEIDPEVVFEPIQKNAFFTYDRELPKEEDYLTLQRY